MAVGSIVILAVGLGKGVEVKVGVSVVAAIGDRTREGAAVTVDPHAISDREIPAK